MIYHLIHSSDSNSKPVNQSEADNQSAKQVTEQLQFSNKYNQKEKTLL